MADYKFAVGDTVVIENTREETEILNDAGSHTGPQAVPEGQFAYQSADVEVPIYLTNMTKVLKPGDTLTIKCAHASESAFYQKAAADLGIGVTVTPEEGS